MEPNPVDIPKYLCVLIYGSIAKATQGVPFQSTKSKSAPCTTVVLLFMLPMGSSIQLYWMELSKKHRHYHCFLIH